MPAIGLWLRAVKSLISRTYVRGILTFTGSPRDSRSDFQWEGQQMTRPPQPVSLAGSQLGEVRHVCALFANDDEEYRVLLPFIRERLFCGDKALQVVNPEQRQEHLRRLTAMGIDSSAYEKSGQREIHNNADVYLHDGHFD